MPVPEDSDANIFSCGVRDWVARAGMGCWQGHARLGAGFSRPRAVGLPRSTALGLACRERLGGLDVAT